MKFYCNLDDLSDYERENNRISYARLVDRVGDIWLFNNALELSNYKYSFKLNSDYDEETGENIDIYQYYLIDTNDYRLEKLRDIGCKDLIIAWSDKLENYILFVDHYGTSWDYVLTDFEPTDNLEESDF